MKYQIFIILLLCAAVCSCSHNRIKIEQIELLKINFLPSPGFIIKEFEISYGEDGDLTTVPGAVNRSSWISFLFVPKTVVIEGEYIIEVIYKDHSKDIFIIDKPNYIYWENKDKWLHSGRDDDLLFIMREILFNKLLNDKNK